MLRCLPYNIAVSLLQVLKTYRRLTKFPVLVTDVVKFNEKLA